MPVEPGGTEYGAVTTGVAGIGLTVTTVAADGALEQPSAVTTTV